MELHPKFDLLLDFFTHRRREIPASTKDLECNLRVHTLSLKSIGPAHDISETSVSKVAGSVNIAPTFSCTRRGCLGERGELCTRRCDSDLRDLGLASAVKGQA
jgi:hypothetical protein